MNLKKNQLTELNKTVIKLQIQLVWPHLLLLITWLCKIFLQAQISVSVSPGTVLELFFGAWQDLAGQTLTRPFDARPRKCHLAGVNDYHSNGRVTCSQQEPRSLHLSASHFPCPLFISLQVNYSSCTTWRHKSTAQTLQKNPAHSVYWYNNL